MAQIMKYWEWPPVGDSSSTYSPDYTKYGQLSADFTKSHYDWDNMPNSAYGPLDFLHLIPIYDVSAVALLMRDCGYAVEMDYEPGGSGATDVAAKDAFKDHFLYKNSVSFKYRPNKNYGVPYTSTVPYTDAEWKTILKTDLAAGRPILYGGNAPGAAVGHTFVCDGYDSSDKFHFNWGWDGNYNGYYSVNDLTPGIWPDTNNFNDLNDIVIGIEPDYSSRTEIYVDDNYTKTSCGGHKWGVNAFNNSQAGINAVLTGGTVHVYAGTYKENLTLTKDDIFIIGENGASSTIIDGQNKGSVIYAKNVGSTTVIDGFTIRNGSGSVYWGSTKGGGGIYFWNVNYPRISNCIIINNSADKGGGVYNYNSSPHFLNCTFQNNYAKGAYPKGIGGGLYNFGASAPVIEHCSFRYNKADTSAGGLYTGGSTSTTTISKCDFVGNSAGDEGGALSGGAITNYGSKAKFINCSIYRNSATVYGGAFYNYSSADPVITNCVVFKNSAKTPSTYYGGAMYNYGSGTNPVVTNSVFWDNTPSEIYNSSSSSTTVNYSNIEGGYSGTDNLNTDPKFINMSANDFHLKPGSPCINVGNNSAPSIADFDPDGQQRILYGTADIGVYEYVNKRPVADANGPYSAAEGTEITFDASGSSDPDGDTLEYRWDFDNDGTWDTAYSTTATAAYTIYDDYSGIVKVEVYDGLEAVEDTAALTVSNVAPSADLVNDGPVDEGSPATVTFTNVVDPGTLDTHTYSFDWDNDGTYDIVDQVAPSAQYTWYDNGVFTVKGKIMDDNSGYNEYTTDVQVDNVAPTVDAGPDQTVNEADVVNFSGSYSDPGTLDTHTFEWDFDDGTTNSSSLTPSHVYGDNGTFTVELTVTDDDGAVSDDTIVITVNNLAPSIDPLPTYNVNEGTSLTFNGRGIDLGSDDLTFTWSWGDYSPDTTTIYYNNGSSGDPAISPEVNPMDIIDTVDHTFLDDGVYTVTLTVSDDDGAMSTETTTVTVNNVAPSTTIDGYTQPFEDFILPTDVLHFTGSYTDPGILDTHTIEWDFGDSAIVTGTLTPTHSYSAPGIYTVTLTVTDDDGGVDTDSVLIEVLSTDDATETVCGDVEDMNMPKGLEDSCLSKLDNAIKSIEKGKDNAAANQLEAFINHVKAQSGKKISEEDADALIAAAQWIIDNLIEK
jgi:PKD repeat protein